MRLDYAPLRGFLAGAFAADGTSLNVRYGVLDLSRLMAVVMMIQGHAIGTLVMASKVPADGWFWLLYMPLRGLTASTFLLISGLVNFVGLRRDAHGRVLPRVLLRRLRRGAALILVDFLLTFPARNVPELSLLTSAQWFEFLTVGTLNIIGVSLILLTVVMALTRSDRAFALVSLVVGVAIMVATPFVHQVDWFAHLPAFIAHYLSFDGGSHFLIFPHSAYLFLGAALGLPVLQWLRDPKPWTLSVRLGLVGATCGVIGIVGAPVIEAMLPAHDRWLSSPALVLERFGGSLLMVAVYAVLFQLTSRAAGVYALISRKTIHIYVAHILLIFGHVLLRPPTLSLHGQLGWPTAVLVTLAVVVGSVGAGALVAWLDRDRHALYVRLRLAGAVLLAYFFWYGTTPAP